MQVYTYLCVVWCIYIYIYVLRLSSFRIWVCRALFGVVCRGSLFGDKPLWLNHLKSGPTKLSMSTKGSGTRSNSQPREFNKWVWVTRMISLPEWIGQKSRQTFCAPLNWSRRLTSESKWRICSSPIFLKPDLGARQRSHSRLCGGTAWLEDCSSKSSVSLSPFVWLTSDRVDWQKTSPNVLFTTKMSAQKV